MQSKRTDGRAFYAVLIALICLHVILIATARLYPFVDLPNHLTAATIHRHYGDESNRFSSYFTLDLFLKPNTFHTLFCGLSVFGSVETANRIYLCIYVILLPVSMLFLIGRLGGNRWFSLLSFLIVYNLNVSWGFVGFVLAVPLALLFIHAAIDFIERGPWGAGLAAAALLVFIFFVHVLAALFSMLVFLTYCLLSGKPPIRILERCAVLAPAAALTIIWWSAEDAAYRGRGLGSFLGDYYAHHFIGTFPERLALLYQDNRHLFAGGRGIAVGALFSLCIIAPVLASALLAGVRGRSGRPRPSRRRPGQAAVILFYCSLACVLLLPHEIPQQTFLYERFVPMLLLSVILIGGCLAPEGLRRAAIIGICAVCVVHGALWAEYLHDFNERNGQFTPEFFPPGNDGSVLAGIIADYTYRGLPVYIHFPSYYIVWRRGIATTRIVDYRFGSVRRAASADELPPYLEWAEKFKRYDGRYRNMDYLLIRGEFPLRMFEGFAGFTPVRTAGEWSLYEHNR